MTPAPNQPASTEETPSTTGTRTDKDRKNAWVISGLGDDHPQDKSCNGSSNHSEDAHEEGTHLGLITAVVRQWGCSGGGSHHGGHGPRGLGVLH